MKRSNNRCRSRIRSFNSLREAYLLILLLSLFFTNPNYFDITSSDPSLSNTSSNGGIGCLDPYSGESYVGFNGLYLYPSNVSELEALLVDLCFLTGVGDVRISSFKRPISSPVHQVPSTVWVDDSAGFGTPINSPADASLSLESGVVFVLSILVVVINVIWWFIILRRRLSGGGVGIQAAGPKSFSYSELCKATNNFAEEFKLGEGGFGPVFRGSYTNPKGETIDVAVKKMKSGSLQGHKEFMAEINIISSLRHRNLVKLIGWCYQVNELVVVYELMPNSSLDKHLYNDGLIVLDWETRYKISCGLAAGLQYLHEGWDKCVVHRDIKSSNVMLDSDFSPRLGDFGLARFSDHGKSMDLTIPAGTIGYMAPELFLGVKASKESDVYSFGIVTLEIATGRKAIFEIESGEAREVVKVQLLKWVIDLEGKGCILDAVDERLGGFDIDEARQLLEVGLWCCQSEASTRPSMSQVMAMLKSDHDLHISLSFAPSTYQSSRTEYYTPSGSFNDNRMMDLSV